MPSVKKNLLLEISYQIISVSLPLITAPYLARVLGPTPLGIFSYTSAVVGYFTLFAILGTVNYGTRTIASVRGNKTLLNINFWGIFALQVGSTLIFSFAYLVYILFFCRENQWMSIIQGLMLLGCVGNISWLFFGLENFAVPVTRSIIVRLITLVCILFFVKCPADLWIYTLIMAGGTVLSQAILWFNLPEFIHFQLPTKQEIIGHIKPNLMLFFPLLAISVYHLMDKTMLGILSTYEQTGFYYNADKVVNIPLAVLNGVGTVLLPRMSALTQEKKYHEADKLFGDAICGISVISIAMGIGIASVAKNFVPIFFGPGYEPCILLVYLFAPIFIMKSFSHISSTQFLIPRHQEKELTIAICLGAVVNVACNIILIPIYGALGAVIGTLMAELVSCLWQFRFIIPVIPLKNIFYQVGIYLCLGGVMWGGVTLLQAQIHNQIIALILGILVGSMIYISLCILYWRISYNPLLLHIQQYWQSIKNRLKFQKLF